MQNLINQVFFYLFIICYIGGVILYNIIGFELIDEICVVFITSLFIYVMFKHKDWEINKVFLLTIGIFIFYFIYSLKINSNTPKAIISDFLIQIKPYLAFFCVYQMKPLMDEKQKKLLNHISLVCWFLLLPIGLAGLVNVQNFISIIGHPTSFAAAVTASALLYLYTSEGTKQNKIIFIALLSIGIISGRSKFYGFFILASAIVLFFNDIKKLNLSLKNIVAILCLFAVILWITKDKIQFYFFQGVSGDVVQTDYLARMALYVTSISIFQDYFPFGSGFASFGTHYSGVYYSNIYSEYGIDNIWGLNRTYTSFVADTYYPSLAQFGIVGAILYVVFWLYITKRALTFKLTNKNIYIFSIILCIIGFIAIENIADASFTGNKGVFMMMFIGYIFSNLQAQEKSLKNAIER